MQEARHRTAEVETQILEKLDPALLCGFSVARATFPLVFPFKPVWVEIL